MNLKYCFLAGLLVIGAAGCNRDNDTTPGQPPLTSQEVKAGQSKDDFMAAMDRQMKELDAKIDDLSQKAANLKDDAKVQADKALDALRADRDAARKKYDDLKQSSQDNWDKTKAAFQAAWSDVEKAYDDARAKFNPSTNSATPNP
jgi:hypothetical protein